MTSSIAIRPATAADAPALAEYARLAGHGLMELYYHGLIPGQTVNQSIAARRIGNGESFNHWSRWSVATGSGAEALGGLNCFAHSVFHDSPPDPLLSGWQMDLTAGLWDMEMALAKGTFYLNMIAVNPEARGRGLGNILMAECLNRARAEGFSRVTLCTYEEDAGLMAFYRRHGFTVIGRTPIPSHPMLEYGGEWVLMARALSPAR